ncbi:hypothetical protein Dimus_033475 [Dionaea muscipula]
MNHFNDASKEVEIAIDKIMASHASSAHSIIEAALPHPVIEAALPHPVIESTLPHLETSSTHPGTGASSVHILNPHVSQTKGRKKGKEVVHGSGRIKSSVEIATKKWKRKCRCCNQMVRHDTRTCPLNPNSRKKYVESTEDDEEDREMGEDVDSFDVMLWLSLSVEAASLSCEVLKLLACEVLKLLVVKSPSCAEVMLWLCCAEAAAVL